MRHPNQESGLTTIEMVIVISLFGIVLVSLVGLHLVALSAGSAAETSTIAANLARARMEQLLAVPPDKLKGQNNVDARQVPADGGRVYTVYTTIEAPDPARLDLTVSVTWQLTYVGACAAGPGTNCVGIPVQCVRDVRSSRANRRPPPAAGPCSAG